MLNQLQIKCCQHSGKELEFYLIIKITIKIRIKSRANNWKIQLLINLLNTGYYFSRSNGNTTKHKVAYIAFI